MNQINNLSNDAYQVTHIKLDDGSIVDMTLRYIPSTQQWLYDINHSLLTVTGRLLCNHLNVLRSFKNVIPFGVACSVTDGTEPLLQDDFINGRVNIYILNAQDVQSIESIIGSL